MVPFQPELNVIHLQNDTEHSRRRYEKFISQFAEQGINFRIWDGVICTKYTDPMKNTREAINLAHKRLVAYARQQQLPFIIIAEDDIIFTDKNSWQYFLSKLPPPETFDLFFGMVYSAQFDGDKITNGFSGLTMYCVSSRFYDFFLSIPDDVHIDRWLGQTAFEHTYLVCRPYVCLQTGGYSYNLRREAHYEGYTDEMEFLGQKGKFFRKGKWTTNQQEGF